MKKVLVHRTSTYDRKKHCVEQYATNSILNLNLKIK